MNEKCEINFSNKIVVRKQKNAEKLKVLTALIW